jgi:hypothetical protein
MAWTGLLAPAALGFHFRRRVLVTGIENVGVFIWEKVWLENSLSQSEILQHSTPFIPHTYPPMKMEQTECSETLAYKVQTPGNYPEESIKHPE